MTDQLYLILSGFLIAGVLLGVALQNKVKTARLGNILSALTTTLAIIITLYRYQLFSDTLLISSIIISMIIGMVGAMFIKMIEMPQVVALLNGFGGAASALVGLLILSPDILIFEQVSALLAIVIGFATLSGSLVAAAKLHRLISQKVVVLKYHSFLSNLWLALALLSVVLVGFVAGGQLPILALVASVASLLFGYYFAIRVGGADMPITISLLNSLSGVAGAIAGMAINDPFLVAVGALVGSAGLLLTQIMCRAMNRSLAQILLGQTSISDVSPTSEKPQVIEPEASLQKEVVIEDLIQIIENAQDIMIIPGYGMALSQAQELVKALADQLLKVNKTVRYAIHPVAGRMPGHMNVLLAEVDVDYEDLLEMDEANVAFSSIDLALVVGANDVINPAATTEKDTPIYGMPILELSDVKDIIICNFDREPGYSGVHNPLYDKEHVHLLLGDAKDSLKQLLEHMH